MKIKNIISTSVLLSGLAFASVSNAAVFDFAHYADDVYGESAWETFTATEDGVTLDAYANTPEGAYAYLDYGDAGLGVCSTGLKSDPGTKPWSNKCRIAADDNVTIGEVLTLDFGTRDVNITDMLLKDAVHNTFSGNIMVSVDGGAATSYNGNQILSGKIFDFYTDNGQFYINTLTANVPAPAPLALLAAGLLGIYGVSRKAKKAKA